MTANPATAPLEASIRSYVAAGSGLRSQVVIPGNDVGPAPQELYASVLLIHQEIRGIPANIFDGEAEGRTLATVHGRYSVQWFRSGARDAAFRLAVWISSSVGLEAAVSRGFTMLRVSDVRQLDELVSDAWEERAGLDLDLGYSYLLAAPLHPIETVAIEVRGERHTYEIEVGT